MAVYEQTYEPWTGRSQPRYRRALAIFTSTFKLTWQSLLVKLFLIFLFIIVSFWTGLLMFLATINLPPIFAVGNRIYNDGFFGLPVFHQLFMVVAAVAGAALISRDRRNNAFSMYFSKAIGRPDYILGKYLVILAFIGLATFAPGFVLWIGQVTVGPESYSVGQHLRDLLAIFAHSMVIALPCGAMILMFSAFSKTTYLPAISWILVYEGTELTSFLLRSAVDDSWPFLLSIRNLLTGLGQSFYEVRPVITKVTLRSLGGHIDVPYSPWVLAGILAAITLVSLWIVSRRLRSFESTE